MPWRVGARRRRVRGLTCSLRSRGLPASSAAWPWAWRTPRTAFPLFAPGWRAACLGRAAGPFRWASFSSRLAHRLPGLGSGSVSVGVAAKAFRMFRADCFERIVSPGARADLPRVPPSCRRAVRLARVRALWGRRVLLCRRPALPPAGAGSGVLWQALGRAEPLSQRSPERGLDFFSGKEQGKSISFFNNRGRRPSPLFDNRGDARAPINDCGDVRVPCLTIAGRSNLHYRSWGRSSLH